ncbi:MAG: restriction endonuclease subunit S [Schwartzia sp.]|nr:restriction endonuclease subunit S [Schwartzia sp. (in: firmicutes)]
MSGLECSEITVKELDELQLRLDAEFYRKHNLKVVAMIDGLSHTTVENLKVVIDCSAFYPGVVDIYNFGGEGIPFIRVNEITNFGLVSVTEATAFLSKDFLDDNSATMARCKPGDIVIAKGGNTLAKTGILNDNFSDYATCRDIVILRTDLLILPMKYYVWAYLQSDYGQTLLWQTASQTGQPHLTLEYIKKLKIPLFSDAFYGAIQYCYQQSQSINETANAKYKNAETLLLSALDLDTFTPSNENTSVKTFSQFTASGRLDAEYYQKKYDDLEEKLSRFPQVKIGDLVNYPVSSGSTPKAGSAEYYTDKVDGIPFIRAVNITKSRVDTDDFVYVKPEVHNGLLRKTRLKKDDVLFSIAGTVGRCGIFDYDFEANINQAVSILRFSEEKVKRLYLIQFFNSTAGKMIVEKYSRQGLQTNLNLDEVSALSIPIIDYAAQTKISTLVEQSFSLREKSKAMLKAATRAVEIAIEQDEAAGVEFLREQQAVNNF